MGTLLTIGGFWLLLVTVALVETARYTRQARNELRKIGERLDRLDVSVER